MDGPGETQFPHGPVGRPTWSAIRGRCAAWRSTNVWPGSHCGSRPHGAAVVQRVLRTPQRRGDPSGVLHDPKRIRTTTGTRSTSQPVPVHHFPPNSCARARGAVPTVHSSCMSLSCALVGSSIGPRLRMVSLAGRVGGFVASRFAAIRRRPAPGSQASARSWFWSISSP